MVNSISIATGHWTSVGQSTKYLLININRFYDKNDKNIDLFWEKEFFRSYLYRGFDVSDLVITSY